MSKAIDNNRRTINSLLKLKGNGEKIAMLTCYDATFAKLCMETDVDSLLIGDSLGMVIQGRETTLGVSLDDICYHLQIVANNAKNQFIIADMPFGYYQKSKYQAYDSAAKLMQKGAQMVKIEGGEVMIETVEYLSSRGIPVCSHIGLTPQFINKIGGYKIQGKDEKAQELLIDVAIKHQNAGAELLLLELVPADLAKKITAKLTIPTIGIGAGPDCSGQVLVIYDALNIATGKMPKFVKNFLTNNSILDAIKDYVSEVKSGKYPGPEHSY